MCANRRAGQSSCGPTRRWRTRHSARSPGGVGAAAPSVLTSGKVWPSFSQPPTSTRARRAHCANGRMSSVARACAPAITASSCATASAAACPSSHSRGGGSGVREQELEEVRALEAQVEHAQRAEPRELRERAARAHRREHARDRTSRWRVGERLSWHGAAPSARSTMRSRRAARTARARAVGEPADVLEAEVDEEAADARARQPRARRAAACVAELAARTARSSSSRAPVIAALDRR